MVERAQPRVLTREPHLLHDTRAGSSEVRHIYRLREKILGAELHRLDRGFDVALPGQQDNGAVLAPQPLQDDEAARVGQTQVEDHDVGPHSAKRLDPLFAGALAPHLVADALEVVADAPQHRRIVVDQQQGVSHCVTP